MPPTQAAEVTPVAPSSLTAVLEQIRAKYQLPALGGAIFTTDGVVEMGVTGVRKAGSEVPATTKDVWHLGSDTKMMTAFLAGTLVAEGKLSWDAKVAGFFPELSHKLPYAVQEITLDQLLSHQAGMVNNLPWNTYTGAVAGQRWVAAQEALMKPAFTPDTYNYSNADYVVAAVILEKITGQTWEALMQQRIFTPLHMDSAGFGGVGTPGQIDQPWPHRADGKPMPNNGPAVDNPPVMAPAGTVHASMEDWAKFLTDQLRGATGQKALLPTNIYTAMQTPQAGFTYAYGWDHPSSSPHILYHSGSNTMNFCVCWLLPDHKFGVLVCTNEGGNAAAQACDAVAHALMDRQLARQAR